MNKESEKVDPTVDNLHGELANKKRASANFIFLIILLLGSFLIFRIQNIESSDTVCPDYFRWIHEDLRPWKNTGISRAMLESAKNSSNFRLVILNGRAYLEKLQPAYQTRDLFTIWGIVQLLRLYPGMVPDLELMFQCDDVPWIKKRDYEGPNATSLVPPVLFQYCSRDSGVSVVFPDWSFWGWPEVNIDPWGRMLKGIIKESKKMKWKKRAPYAFWKGNPRVTPNRKGLMKCNLSDEYDWNARLYSQVNTTLSLYLETVRVHGLPPVLKPILIEVVFGKSMPQNRQ
ncbi:hypothetical protein M5689_004906 [Euphorbia peplus]|nr:hypothetical protein M5689_004906 [Euphorbia peplus]